jgi:hypothetical protein
MHKPCRCPKALFSRVLNPPVAQSLLTFACAAQMLRSSGIAKLSGFQHNIPVKFPTEHLSFETPHRRDYIK